MPIGYKICTVCKVERPYIDFRKRTTAIDGKRSQCKFCEDSIKRNKDRTKLGKAKRIALQQPHSAKRRNHSIPTYTRKELVEWLYSQPLYHTLYNAWKNSGYTKKLAPSVNRINPRESYSMDNIELITWGENHKLAVEDRQNGIDKIAKPVLQYTLQGEFIQEWISAGVIAKTLHCEQTSISQACRGVIETSNGYQWRYK